MLMCLHENPRTPEDCEGKPNTAYKKLPTEKQNHEEAPRF